MLRRFEEIEQISGRISVHDIVIDKDRYIVSQGEEEIHCPGKEFELLYFLAGRKGKIMARQTLLDHIWGKDMYVIDHTVDAHVRKIREKLGKEYTEAIKGMGTALKKEPRAGRWSGPRLRRRRPYWRSRACRRVPYYPEIKSVVASSSSLSLLL